MRAGTSAVVGGVLLALIEGLTAMLSNPAFLGQDSMPPPPPMPEPAQQMPQEEQDPFAGAYSGFGEPKQEEQPFGFSTR